MSGKLFRSDINGLRAWAVAAVVLYHFGVAGVDGGFVGVDVFFVISGFLMAGIILRGLEAKSFSLWAFYVSRGRRIYPALAVVCVALLVFGARYLMPSEYEEFGRHARESLLFSSNYRYYAEAGYFDVAAREKWLLHTWSLSVEWQFYLLLPLLLMLAWRVGWGRNFIICFVAALFLGSFACSVWLSSENPSRAFYLIESRAWEMLAGVMLYVLLPFYRPRDKVARSLEFSGFAIIVASVVFFDKEMRWPGWWALLPVLGAVFVLIAARERSMFTGGAIAQWLGSRSYSIYLWHWPVVVGLAYVDKLTVMSWLVAGIVLSIVLGHFSYVLVEQPSGMALSKMPPRRAAALLVGVALVLGVAAQQVRRHGLPERLPEVVAKVDAERHNKNPRSRECLNRPEATCIYGGEPVRAILVGDSHADSIVTALQASLPDGKGGIYFKGVSSCLIAFDLQAEDDRQACLDLNRWLKASHESIYPGVPIVVMGRTSSYINGAVEGDVRPAYWFGFKFSVMSSEYFSEFKVRYIDTLCSLAEHRQVYVVRPTPVMPVNVPARYGHGLLLGREVEVGLPVENYISYNKFIWRAQDEAVERCGVRVLDPTPYLCNDGFCHGVVEGRPIYRDEDHLSEYGNRLLVPLLRQIFVGNQVVAR